MVKKSIKELMRPLGVGESIGLGDRYVALEVDRRRGCFGGSVTSFTSRDARLAGNM